MNKFVVQVKPRGCPIPGYPNYLISKNGDIWSLKRSKFLAPQVQERRNGYLCVKVNLSGGTKTVARLMAMTYFKADLTVDDIIDHINGDSTDNRLDNIRIVTKAQNNANQKCAGSLVLVPAQTRYEMWLSPPIGKKARQKSRATEKELIEVVDEFIEQNPGYKKNPVRQITRADSWKVTWCPEPGKRQRRAFPNKEDAEKYLNECKEAKPRDYGMF